MFKILISIKLYTVAILSALFFCSSVCNSPSTPEESDGNHFPLPGAKVISPYGKRGGKMHTGVDIKTKAGDSIYAAFDGEVVFSGKYYGYGNFIRIKHTKGLETCYSHNSKNFVKVGYQVKAGQVIGIVGQTGRATTPHLHLEVRVNGKPVNPGKYFDLDKGVVRKNKVK